ncbi:mCG147887 [Mus musculus]|nr:mCG147887 [Mus musculus]
MELNDCLKDWFIKWTWILGLVIMMIPMMKTVQNPYQPAKLTWSVVSMLTGDQIHSAP